MYIHLGQSVMVPQASILGIFDLDNTTQSHRTRAFLEKAEKEGRLIPLFDDLPKSFVLCQEGGETTVYMTQLASSTLLKRAEGNGLG